MIKEIEGNILDFKNGIIAHQVNCFKIGSGLAKAIIEEYPIVLEEFNKLLVISPERKLGGCQLIKVNNHLSIANLYGQLYYGYDGTRYTNYIAITQALSKLFSIANCNIAIPYNMSSYRGGAKWELIYNIIKTLAIDFPHDVYIYKFNKE